VAPSASYVVINMTPLPSALIRPLLAAYAHDLSIEVVDVHGKDRGYVLSQLERADVVIGDYTFSMKIDREMLDRMARVRLIAQPSTGYDHIDVEYAAKRGIPVANIGAANAASVAEHTILLALALLKRLGQAHARTAGGRWAQQEFMDLGVYELQGKTWGILGFGRIGREVAKRLAGWGVRLLYYDKVRAPEELERQLGAAPSDLAGLLRQADVVSVHLPLSLETSRLLGERELRMMKPTAVLVNTSRGEIVDEQALARALEQRWILGAAVDVFSSEPPPSDHPLIRLAAMGANVLLTPHIAGATAEARQRIIQVTVENVVRALKGERPLNVVNLS